MLILWTNELILRTRNWGTTPLITSIKLRLFVWSHDQRVECVKSRVVIREENPYLWTREISSFFRLKMIVSIRARWQRQTQTWLKVSRVSLQEGQFQPVYRSERQSLTCSTVGSSSKRNLILWDFLFDAKKEVSVVFSSSLRTKKVVVQSISELI